MLDNCADDGILLDDNSDTDRNIYDEFKSNVANFAGVLRKQGIIKGDSVIIYMHLIPEQAL